MGRGQQAGAGPEAGLKWEVRVRRDGAALAESPSLEEPQFPLGKMRRVQGRQGEGRASRCLKLLASDQTLHLFIQPIHLPV